MIPARTQIEVKLLSLLVCFFYSLINYEAKSYLSEIAQMVAARLKSKYDLSSQFPEFKHENYSHQPSFTEAVDMHQNF